MSITLDLKTASTEQCAAQLLVVLRRNQVRPPDAGYYHNSLIAILEYEFAPAATGVGVGVRPHKGGAVAIFGPTYPPPWLKEKFFDAVHWLQQRGYIRQDRSQRSDEFMEPTAEGGQVEIDPAAMTFVMVRKWTHWRSQYADSVFQLSIRYKGGTAGGTAFLVGPRLFATCAHNVVGEMSVYLGDDPVPVPAPVLHEAADVAVFSLAGGVEIPGRPLPIRPSLPEPAEEVAALGYPTVPRRLPTLNILPGAVESLPTDYKGKQQFIQVSFASSGGLSGGPVIDQCGRVVGIVSERTFEAVADAAVPAKAFPQVVPISYLKDITG